MLPYRIILAVSLTLVLMSQDVRAQGRDEFTPQSEFYRTYSQLTQVPTDIPDNALKVYLNQNKIRNLPANAFSNLGSCEVLGVYDNEITTIADGAFNGLSSLTNLFFQRNKIPSISANVFKGLTSLKYLQLQENEITTISPGAFSDLTNCKALSLHYNKITTIADGTFKGLDSILELYLDYNKIRTIPVNELKGLTTLTKLDLHGNGIYTIQSSSFASLKNLEHLSLSNNELDSISSDMFIGLQSLTIFFISNIGMTTLNPDVLSVLPRPLQLYLGNTIDGADPMICDVKLCWLKLEEEAGDITVRQAPTCANGVDWSTFNCNQPVPCTDPGESEFSTRTWTGSPFTTGSTITYTCDSCSLGGGTITCQSNGQYDNPKPICEKLTCPGPQIENGRLVPSNDEYRCGEEVLFACNKGFTIMGEITRMCGSSGQFDGNTTCVENDCPRLQTENESLDQGQQTEKDCKELLVGIISGAGGALLVVVLVGVVICCKRICKNKK